MMRATGRCKSDLVTSPHQRVVGLGPRQQPTVDTFGVAPAKGTDQNLYSDCSGMCRLRREGLAASSCFKVLYPYFGWLGIPERFEDRRCSGPSHAGLETGCATRRPASAHRRRFKKPRTALKMTWAAAPRRLLEGFRAQRWIHRAARCCVSDTSGSLRASAAGTYW